MKTTAISNQSIKTSSLSVNVDGKLSTVRSRKQQKVESLQKQLLHPGINFLEDRIAALLNADSALAVKSTKSAIYLLVKNLLKRGENIVTLNSVSLFKNEIIRERLGIEVRLAEDESVDHFKSLVDTDTKLIFLESLGVENLIIPDFQKIVAFAKSKNILVAVDNTVGIAGSIINPISLGVHFSVENISKWIEKGVKPYGAVLVDGRNYNEESGLFKKFAGKTSDFSLVSHINSNTFSRKSSPVIPENVFDQIKELEELPRKVSNISATTLSTAKWLKEIRHVQKVDYVGFASHPSYFNALRYYSGGFGHIISFSLWVNFRSFDFFLDNLIPKSSKLFEILDINYGQKRITIALLESDYEKQLQYFQNNFDLLQKYLGSDYFLYEDLYDVQDAVGY